MLLKKKFLSLFIVCVPFLFTCFSQNPIVPGYFADPSVRLLDGKYYLSATTDGNEGFNGEPLLWVSEDLVNWEVNTLHIPERLFWAPSMVKGKNGKFYMVNQHGIDYNAYISEGETPFGPWKQKAQIGDFDVELFVDPVTEQIFGIGSWKNLMVFNNDIHSPGYMQEVINRIPLQGDLTDFTEGPYIFYKDEKYYLMWAGGRCWLETYNIRYAVADHLTGPYTEPTKDAILETDKSQGIFGPGHTSVLEVNGHWIMFYHRQDKYKYPTCNYRFSCASEIFFSPDGSIEKVVPLDDLSFLNLSGKVQKNLALGKPANSDSYEGEHVPARVTDGRNDTKWKATPGEDKLITIDLGKEEEIKKVQVDFEYPDRFYLYKIEYSSDNVHWHTYADYSTRAQKAYQTRNSEKEVKARYIKVNVTRGENGYVAMWGIKVF